MDKKCKKCRYRARLGSGMEMCDYIGQTGHSRGCKADADCDKYEPKKRGRKAKNEKGQD